MMAEKWPSLEDCGATEICEKVLSASDNDGSGKLEVSKAVALQLQAALSKDAVEFACQDTFGKSHMFRWTASRSSQGQGHALEGTHAVQAAYRLTPGDSLVFGQLRSGELVTCGKLGPRRRVPTPQPAAEKIVITLDRSRRRRKTQTPYDPSDEGGGPEPPKKSRKAAEPELGHLDTRLPPCADGTFRSVLTAEPCSAGAVEEEHGFWAASFISAGETYRAYFQSEEEAQEALLAVGS